MRSTPQHRGSPLTWLPSLTVLSVLACAPADAPPAADAAMSPVERGEYLTTVAGCHDCHTPKVFTETGPVFDSTRLLSGHPADVPTAPVPAGIGDPMGWLAATNAHLSAWVGPWGTSFAANLTPDTSGAMAGWTADVFIATLRTGKHAGVGRPILPPMPWEVIGKMTDDDLRAVFAYLQSLPPVTNRVPTPLPPGGAGE